MSPLPKQEGAEEGFLKTGVALSSTQFLIDNSNGLFITYSYRFVYPSA
jgi:hypothetical protein